MKTETRLKMGAAIVVGVAVLSFSLVVGIIYTIAHFIHKLW